jgi:hypothetical protein
VEDLERVLRLNKSRGGTKHDRAQPSRARSRTRTS